jgi:hypothetical protein
VKFACTGSNKVPRGETKNVEVLNGALQMTQNLAEQIGRLCSRIGRFPWLFPSLNLDRSHSELAQSSGLLKYFMRLVPIGFAYCRSFDRIFNCGFLQTARMTGMKQFPWFF